MISARTVFVLGAGASTPYGLPVGRKLFEFVLAECRAGRSAGDNIIKTTEFEAKHLEEFIGELEYFGSYSVDAFLEKRTSFLEIGKAAIASQLIVREHQGNLWNDSQGNNWMMYLYERMMTDTLEEFAENNVSFLTFNYDRSLEHFLSMSLSKTYGKSLEECAPVFDKIPIIHLHGRLGYLPWQNSSLGRHYEGVINQHAMDVCRKSIRVVHEPITDRDDDFNRAKKLLLNAGRVYMLGFGFGSKNVERLGLRELPEGLAAATFSGPTQHELNQTSTLVNGRVDLRLNVDCIGMLRNLAILN